MSKQLPFYYSKAIKYSEANEERAFQQHLMDNPFDKTAALAYVDWLKDNGRDGEATALEAEINSNIKHDSKGNRSQPILRPQLSRTQLPGKHAYIYAKGLDSLLSIGLPSLLEPKYYFHLQAWLPEEKARETLKQLSDSGYKLAGRDFIFADNYVNDATKEYLGK